jgi:pyruvate,orthophosphate dikinase
MKKYCYYFGGGKSDGNAAMKDTLGGKGANLAEMTNLGLPVPPGFTISAEVCDLYYKNSQKMPADLMKQVGQYLAKVEKEMKASMGDPANPLLLSVRSGAAVSMPGMMDTVLNLGLNNTVVEGLAKKTNNPRFAWDAYRRFIQMFSDVVLGMEHHDFEHLLAEVKREVGANYDTDLKDEDLRKVVRKYLALVKEKTGHEFPAYPKEQLKRAIESVFSSWNSKRAITYRKIENISGLLGTAVNVQAMVFGNMGNNSGTGVLFTRNPITGAREIYGDYLMNAQGEDVVAGIRTPKHISELAADSPDMHKQIATILARLEKHYRDVQDVEFTIQEGRLFMLQTRDAKRTPAATVIIAVDMVKEKMITREEAVMRVQPSALDNLLHPTFKPGVKREVIAKGINASPGAAVGQVVFTADEAEEWAKNGKKVVLVRQETSPEDVGGMHVAEGILTSTGGKASHAALVARGMGRCCVVGCGDIEIDYSKKQFTAKDGVIVKEGDFISVDGGTGEVMRGTLETVHATNIPQYDTLMKWVDQIRRLNVRTNSDTIHDTEIARQRFGAEGIGLTRTEHMFFAPDRITAMREMIIAETVEEREKALAKIRPMQRDDFFGIFKAMDGFPVTIRLLDPPLHEFLPQDEATQKEVADSLGVSVDVIKQKVINLHELNPMLGHRGCRLGITYPEINKMQARAIMEAACDAKKAGIRVLPEIMVPLTGTLAEMREAKKHIVESCEAVLKEKGMKLDYMVGTMIELPRAALVADKIATEAEFFSFGTNDLTQMTFGYSRDDIGTFLPEYLAKGILPVDPFQSIDQEGVGQLIRMGIERGRATRPKLKVGICGEHGGDPASVKFCHRVGMNYVSCSPFRVPIARLAAAQAVIEDKMAAKKPAPRKAKPARKAKKKSGKR